MSKCNVNKTSKFQKVFKKYEPNLALLTFKKCQDFKSVIHVISGDKAKKK